MLQNNGFQKLNFETTGPDIRELLTMMYMLIFLLLETRLSDGVLSDLVSALCDN